MTSPGSLESAHSPWDRVAQIAMRAGRILMVVAFAALIFLFVVFVIYAVNLIGFPFDYDQAEGFEMWNAVLLSRGQSIYTDNEAYPFYSSLYGPVYPLLLAPFAAIFGPQLWYGRVFSFVVTLVIGGLTFWLVIRETGDRLMALAAPLLFFASNFVYQIGPLFRQHMTMVLFGLLGVIFMGLGADEPDERKAHRRIRAALVFLLLAGYTKPLSIDAVVAAFAFLLLRRPKWVLRYAAGFVVAAGGIFLLLQIVSGGHWFTNIITANSNPFVPGQAAAFYLTWFRLHGVIIVVAAAYAIHTVIQRRISPYALYFAAAVAVGVLSGKWGAGPSYFVDAIAASAIGTGIGLGKLRAWFIEQARQNLERSRRRLAYISLGVWWLAVPLMLTAQARLNLHLPLTHPVTEPVADLLNLEEDPESFRPDTFDTIGYTQVGHLTTAEDVGAGWRIVDRVRNASGPAWTEEAMFALLAGKNVVVTDPLVLYNLYESGNLDPQNMIDMIEAQRFGVVVFRARFYPLPVVQAILDNYEVVEQVEMNGFEYDILLPRDP